MRQTIHGRAVAGGRGILAAMGRERPPDFADRLPRVVPREETDISHLSDEMADLLYPGWHPRPFRIGVRFCAFAGESGERAVALARQSPAYREEKTPDGPVHHAAFDAGAARTLRDLFDLVKGRPGTDVLVDGKKAPYAHELWLPLFWIFVGGEA
jgi:hypothetical protein